ncbi:MAG: hypothetical protein ACREH8_17040, partial [Opitutaceae bacterium]
MTATARTPFSILLLMKTLSLLKTALIGTATLAALLAPRASAQNVWLAEPGMLTVTPAFTYQSFDEFYAGTAKMPLPDDITQRTAALRIDYGLAPRLALDATLGYTEVKFAPPGARFERSGRDDSRLGLTYALFGESAELPAVAFRAGAIFAGNYPIPTSVPPINPGDGASGFEASFAAGKTLGEGFAVYGELGYRNRNHGVPDDFFGNVGVLKQFGPVNVNLGYRRTQGLSGGDIGGPGFGTRFGFPGVKQVAQFYEGGVSFTDGGGRSYQFGAAKCFGDARNTGVATVYT